MNARRLAVCLAVSIPMLVLPWGSSVVADGGTSAMAASLEAVGGGRLPDARAYEMVTPLENHEADVYEPNTESGEGSLIYTDYPFQASANGEKVTYVAAPTVGGNENAGLFGGNQYLATRLPDGGWVQSNISPLSSPAADFEAFSSDLSIGYVDSTEPLSPDAPGSPQGKHLGANYEVLYTTDTDGSEYSPLFTTTPPYRSTETFSTARPYRPGLGGHRSYSTFLDFAGASADSTHLIFEANDALTSDAEGGSAEHYAEENNLYEAFDGQLRLVNVLPDNSTKANATFGAPNYEEGPGGGGYASPDFSHVISSDGSRIFWTDLNTGHIYVREDGTRTVEISPAGQYWTASSDGSKVFYTDGDLYEYEVESGRRTDLTPGTNVRGVIGASEDGEYVYYVTEGYELEVWHDGVARQIKELSPKDKNEVPPYFFRLGGDWEPGFGNRMAEVTPDGHAIVFMSTGGIAENVEVDVYEADSGQLYCASCGPTGTQGFVPLTYSASYLKRWISEDGSRVFFSSLQGLVPRDTNGKLDSYEWERPGSGGCATSTGCIYLLTGGTSQSQSYMADASANGNDVFLVTRAKLLPSDLNENFDLYDARVDGISEPASTACSGTGCQGVPLAPPIFATPSSVTFNGVGNFLPPTPTKVVAKKAKKKTKKTKKTKKASRKSKSGKAGKSRNSKRSSGKGRS